MAKTDIVIHADGTLLEVTPKNRRDYSFEELRAVVGGDPEIVYLRDNRIMAVHGEGRLVGLPRNTEATALYGHEYIAGDVLVCARGRVK